MTSQNPFKYFKTSPKIIRLAVMYYVRYPLSFRQVEHILHERGTLRRVWLCLTTPCGSNIYIIYYINLCTNGYRTRSR